MIQSQLIILFVLGIYNFVGSFIIAYFAFKQLNAPVYNMPMIKISILTGILILYQLFFLRLIVLVI
ncbi:MAG: hypothetical protein ACXACX_13130 [Candidatus Hodarchaeales archaeon]